MANSYYSRPTYVGSPTGYVLPGGTTTSQPKSLPPITSKPSTTWNPFPPAKPNPFIPSPKPTPPSGGGGSGGGGGGGGGSPAPAPSPGTYDTNTGIYTAPDGSHSSYPKAPPGSIIIGNPSGIYTPPISTPTTPSSGVTGVNSPSTSTANLQSDVEKFNQKWSNVSNLYQGSPVLWKQYQEEAGSLNKRIESAQSNYKLY
jgi:hypothetical protein